MSKLTTLDRFTLASAQFFNQAKFALTHDFVPYWRVKHQLQYGDWMFPRSWYFAIDTGCNRTCVYCPRSVKHYARKEMTDEVFLMGLQRFHEIHYTGVLGFNNINEPTLNKKLPWYIKKTRERFPKNYLRFNTNGDFLTVEKMHEYLNAGIDTVVITRHMPTTDEWAHNIADIVRRFPTRIDYRGSIDGSPWLMFWGEASAPSRVDPEPYCRIPHCNAMFVDWDGSISQCQLDTNITQPIGNVLHDGFLEMWNRPWFKALRDEVRANRFVPQSDICKKCLKPVYGPTTEVVS